MQMDEVVRMLMWGTILPVGVRETGLRACEEGEMFRRGFHEDLEGTIATLDEVSPSNNNRSRSWVDTEARGVVATGELIWDKARVRFQSGLVACCPNSLIRPHSLVVRKAEVYRHIRLTNSSQWALAERV